MKVSGAVATSRLFPVLLSIPFFFFLAPCSYCDDPSVEKAEKKRAEVSEMRQRRGRTTKRERDEGTGAWRNGNGYSGPYITGPIKHLPGRVASRTSWRVFYYFYFSSLVRRTDACCLSENLGRERTLSCAKCSFVVTEIEDAFLFCMWYRFSQVSKLCNDEQNATKRDLDCVLTFLLNKSLQPRPMSMK